MSEEKIVPVEKSIKYMAWDLKRIADSLQKFMEAMQNKPSQQTTDF